MNAMPRRIFGNLAADSLLMGTVVVLLTFGLIMVYSASISGGPGGTGGGVATLIKQGVNIGLGLLLMVILTHVPMRKIKEYGPWVLLGGVLLIAAVLLPGIGQRINGSARWLAIGGFRIQPAELMKIAMVIYVAGYLSRHRKELLSFRKGIFNVIALTAGVVLILLLQPDFGSGVVIFSTVLGMLFLAGVRLWHFLSIVVVGVVGMAGIAVLEPYRMARLTMFLDPWGHAFDSGFQLVQALIAFGRGGLFGVGIGASIQKLYYLPAANTDFLMAVIGEELGFVGVVAVLLMYTIILLRAFQIAARAEAQGKFFIARVAQGIALLVALQATINIGVNLGVLPTKGLTLPFLSWGGSSMIASCAAIGLLLRAARETGGTGGRR